MPGGDTKQARWGLHIVTFDKWGCADFWPGEEPLRVLQCVAVDGEPHRYLLVTLQNRIVRGEVHDLPGGEGTFTVKRVEGVFRNV